VERTFAWGNQFGELRWCTERNTPVVEFWPALTHATVTLGRLIRQAWTAYRRDGRPAAALEPARLPAQALSLSFNLRSRLGLLS
jgi:hypothetical protein